jgi:hypothetical protein
MIIRILADNQYRIADADIPEVDRLDDDVMAALNGSDEAAFQSSLRRLVEFVQQRGQVVPHEELVPSQGIVPPADMSLAEARELLESAQIRMPTE